MGVEKSNCGLCGDPMPEGEQMFKYHGYSGPCPKPPLPKTTSTEESFSEQIDRIQLMIADDSDYDLSDNDRLAIGALLEAYLAIKGESGAE